MEKNNTVKTNFGNLTHTHFMVFNAIVLWHNVLAKITEKLENKCCDYSYNAFISNANWLYNPNIEGDIKKAIHDFYDYFYTNQHIADYNHNNYELFTNDYVKLSNVLASGKQIEINMLREVTFYVFDLIVSVREELNLPIFERKPHDQYITKYYTRYYGINGIKI